MRHQLCAVDEIEKAVDNVAEHRLVGELGIADAMNPFGVRMDLLALRVDENVERAPGRKAVDQLHRADLDNAVGILVEAGCFGVEDDFAHGAYFPVRSAISFRTSSRALSSPNPVLIT